MILSKEESRVERKEAVLVAVASKKRMRAARTRELDDSIFFALGLAYARELRPSGM